METNDRCKYILSTLQQRRTLTVECVRDLENQKYELFLVGILGQYSFQKVPDVSEMFCLIQPAVEFYSKPQNG